MASFNTAVSIFLAFVRVRVLPSLSLLSGASTASLEVTASIFLALVRVRVLPSSSLLVDTLLVDALLLLAHMGSSSDDKDFCFLRLVLVEACAGLASLSSDTEAVAAAPPSPSAGDSLVSVVSDEDPCKTQQDSANDKHFHTTKNLSVDFNLLLTPPLS